MILDAGLPKDVRKAIDLSYKNLCESHGDHGDVSVAVRSSATAEGASTHSVSSLQSRFI